MGAKNVSLFATSDIPCLIAYLSSKRKEIIMEEPSAFRYIAICLHHALTVGKQHVGVITTTTRDTIPVEDSQYWIFNPLMSFLRFSQLNKQIKHPSPLPT